MAAVKKWVDDITGTLTTGGSSTAYTLTTNSVFASAAVMSGAMICFIPHTTSGASPTLAVDGLTARQIRYSTGVNVPTGALVQGTPYLVTYIHGSTEFILIGAVGVGGETTQLAKLDITGGTAETAPAVADELALYDASATANRKMTVANFLKVITLLTAETAPAVDDELALYDLSGTSTDKITLANLLKVVNALTEDTTPDPAADFVLTYDASASAPKKVSPNNLRAGGIVLIQTQAASSSATIDFTTGLDDTYDFYEIRFSNVKPATDNVALQMRVGTGAGPTYQSGASAYNWSRVATSSGASTATVSNDAADSQIDLCPTGGSSGIGNDTGESATGAVMFSNPEASDACHFNVSMAYARADGETGGATTTGRYNTAGAITGIRFLMSSGNIASGRFSLYGYKKA